VLRDVELYLPLLRPGGFVVMDDVSWDSVKPALKEVASHARLLLFRVAADGMDDYAVLWKGESRFSAAILSRTLRRLAQS
jgi:predicted O-methyltransferase YrrM